MQSLLGGISDTNSGHRRSGDSARLEARSTSLPGNRDDDWPESKPTAWRILARLDRSVAVSAVIGGTRDVVLLYHSVGGIAGTEYDWNITRRQFREQIRLVSERFDPVKLSDLTEPEPDRKRVAVTFDDGFRNFAEVAAPILRTFEIPATVFVCPSFIGDANAERLRDRHSLGRDARDVVMTAPQIEDILCDDLFTVGNHTVDHPDLTTLGDREAIVEQVVDGKRRLEERFGVTVNQFSYPYGKIDNRASSIVAETHDVAVTSEPSLVSPNPDPNRIPRIDACQPFDTLMFEMTDLGDRLRRIHRRLTA